MPIASAESKESNQTAHKSLPIINHFKFLRETEAIISLVDALTDLSFCDLYI